MVLIRPLSHFLASIASRLLARARTLCDVLLFFQRFIFQICGSGLESGGKVLPGVCFICVHLRVYACVEMHTFLRVCVCVCMCESVRV